MDETTNPQTKAETLAQDRQRTVTVPDLQVGTDGRLYIPATTRERYGIEPGDYVDAVLVVDGE